jgi:uncharacterized membrane protein YfcA
MPFDVLLFVLGIVTGGIAAVAGFGIGSFLTPVLALRIGFDVAVAAVGMAHFFGSALRYFLLRRDVNRRILLSFGVLSAAGGLTGALLQGRASSTALSVIFGGLMVFAGVASLFRWAEKVQLKGPLVWIVGAVSGFFGGLVGNQGGLRAAGLVGFNLRKAEFVATATAIALIVDVFRVPVYVTLHVHQLASFIPEILVMSSGVMIGTLVGAPLLRRLPEARFRVTLSVVLVVVGFLVAARL